MSSVLMRYGATTVLLSGGVGAKGLVNFFVEKVGGVRAATEDSPPHLLQFVQLLQLNSFDDLTIEETVLCEFIGVLL